MTQNEYKIATFKADSALLRELGERLVGQPHIALAELIKNAYDADATRCQIRIKENSIIVSDNGHGMTEEEFLSHWMTIGTTNKQAQGTSRRYSRSVTGSKGVGRLSAQFLAHRMELCTRSEGAEPLKALVDWDEAIAAERLTQAEARYRTGAETFYLPGESSHGTRIEMHGLKQEWDEEAIRLLGRQLWLIQSPLPEFGKLTTQNSDPRAFRVELKAHDRDLDDAFQKQMGAALDGYNAIVEGRIERGERDGKSLVQTTVRFKDGETYSETFDTTSFVQSAKWTIRIFNLQGRQSAGVKVHDARDYLRTFGGVQVYDAGFRLPYYGVEQDWLGVEFDHSHRMNKSALLPERLHVKRALNDLPTQGRIFGVVHIDTGLEAREAKERAKEAGDYLKIQVTRDRLVTNKAYRTLRDAVRMSLDYYATRQRMREESRVDLKRPDEPSFGKLARAEALAASVVFAHPEDENVVALRDEISDLEKTFEREREIDEGTRALLGPLASAGMAALALEHESRKEMRSAKTLVRRLKRLSKHSEDKSLRDAVDSLEGWVARLEGTRRIFAPLLDVEDREQVEALKVGAVLKQVVDNVQPLIAGVRIDLDLPGDIMFPPATFAEWNSLFQNVLINASNAMLDEKDRRLICLEGGRSKMKSWVTVSDRGSGIDWTNSDELFEPFARRSSLSEERRALGLGGMGLGLTIVRMIAQQRRCDVEFVEPSTPWTTTFRLSWSGTK